MNEELEKEIDLLRAQVNDICRNPLLPGAVKNALLTMLNILERLAREVENGSPA